MHCVVLFRRISSSTSKRKKIRPSRGGITFRIVLSPPTATTSMRTIRGALVAAQTIRTVIACERVGVATGWSARHIFDGRHRGAPGIAHGGAVMTVLDDTVGMLLYVVGEMAVTRKLDTEFFAPVLLGFPTRSARSSCPEPAGNSKCGQNCARKPPASWSRPRPGYSSSSRWITSLAPYRRRRQYAALRDHPGKDDSTRKSAHFSTGAGCSGLNRGRQGFAKQTRTRPHRGVPAFGSVTPQRVGENTAGLICCGPPGS